MTGAKTAGGGDPAGEGEVEDDGAPAILWIHAFPLSGEMWDEVTGLLDGAVHLTPNLPGFGGRPAEDGPLDLGAAADALVRLLDDEGLDRAVVAGCSMGGYVALALEERHPERVAGLVLIDSRADADTPEQRAARGAFAAAVEREGVEMLAAAMLPRLVKDPAGAAGEAAAALIRAASPRGAANALAGMGARADHGARLAAIRAPALIIAGADDAIIPLAAAEALAAAIPGARLEVIPDCGHLPPLERPAAVADAVRGFLAAL